MSGGVIVESMYEALIHTWIIAMMIPNRPIALPKISMIRIYKIRKHIRIEHHHLHNLFSLSLSIYIYIYMCVCVCAFIFAYHKMHKHLDKQGSILGVCKSCTTAKWQKGKEKKTKVSTFSVLRYIYIYIYICVCVFE